MKGWRDEGSGALGQGLMGRTGDDPNEFIAEAAGLHDLCRSASSAPGPGPGHERAAEAQQGEGQHLEDEERCARQLGQVCRTAVGSERRKGSRVAFAEAYDVLFVVFAESNLFSCKFIHTCNGALRNCGHIPVC